MNGLRASNYQVITADSSESLGSKVYKELKSEWQLYGSPFIFGGMICQAMTRGGSELSYLVDEFQNANERLEAIEFQLKEIDKTLGTPKN